MPVTVSRAWTLRRRRGVSAPRSNSETDAVVTVRPAARHRQHVEWQRGGAMALHVLGLSLQDYDDWLDEVSVQATLGGRG